jgi:alpha-tubulin suppressor-like RCC1 family protein
MPRCGVFAHRFLWVAPIAALAACKPSPEGPLARSPEPDPPAGPPICEGAAPFQRAERRFPELVSSPYHTCALWGSGRVACWGANDYRQLGDGTWENRLLPTPVLGISDAVDVAVSEGGTCVARRGGAVACWGSPWSPDPAEVPGLRGAVQVAAWKGTACGVVQDGRVVCAGAMDGDGYERTAVGPFELPGVRDAIDVAMGDGGICVLHACGRVSCGPRTWTLVNGKRRLAAPTAIGGLDDARQIVMASYINTSQYERACALRAGGRVTCFSHGAGVASPPEQLGDAAGFVGLGGGQGICAFDASGRASCFGPAISTGDSSPAREIPDQTPLANPVSIAHGGASRCAGLASDEIVCWGHSLGGTTDEILVPLPPAKGIDAAQVSVGRHHTCITRANGDVGCWGPVQLVTMAGDYSPSGYTYMAGQPIAGLHQMAEVAAGDGFVCGRTRAGEIFCFGRNDKGQLGDGPRVEDRQLPTPVEGILDAVSIVAAPAYACALRAGGEVRCWGDHPLSGRLGTKPAAVPELAGAAEIAAGDRHLCGRLSSGRVACVGGKAYLDPEAARDAVQLAAGAVHTCARMKSGHVACWGASGSAATPGDLPEPAVDIAAGGDETCAVLASGRVTCWGRPTLADPWLFVKDAKRVVTSGTHTCVLRKTGEIACWGSSTDGKLGDATIEVRYAPTEIPHSP